MISFMFSILVLALAFTIHNMMGFMKQYYGRAYAENTREVVRRQVIHQFEQARLIDRNPDDPSRPTNSPNTCYALAEDAFQILSQFGFAQTQARTGKAPQRLLC